MATTATTKPTAHEEESSDRLVEATSKILGEREGCGRVLTGVKLLHKVEILRMLFRFESIYVPTALEAISVKDCEWEAIPDAIVGCVAGLDALLRFRGEKPEDRIWRANAGADKATLRRVMLSLLCVPFYDPRGPIAAALPEGSLAAQTRLLSEPITEKLGLVGAYEVDLLRRPGKNCKRSASESNDVGVYFITNTLKRGRKDGQLADKCALGAVSAAVQGLLDDDTDRDRFNVALALREIGEAWPICLLVGGALRISQLCREGASLEDAAESVGRNLDAGVQWMMAERLVPTSRLDFSGARWLSAWTWHDSVARGTDPQRKAAHERVWGEGPGPREADQLAAAVAVPEPAAGRALGGGSAAAGGKSAKLAPGGFGERRAGRLVMTEAAKHVEISAGRPARSEDAKGIQSEHAVHPEECPRSRRGADIHAVQRSAMQCNSVLRNETAYLALVLVFFSISIMMISWSRELVGQSDKAATDGCLRPSSFILRPMDLYRLESHSFT
eukprot:scaffold334_cov241-Pinguiococcus_pyrenoidosus.AAC.35